MTIVSVSPTAPDTLPGETVKGKEAVVLAVTVICTETPSESRTATVADPDATPLTVSTPPLTVAVATAVLLLVAVYGATPPPTE
jgi:putative copper export protein